MDKKISLLEVGHEMAEGLHEAGIVDAKEMKEFDALCLANCPKCGNTSNFFLSENPDYREKYFLVFCIICELRGPESRSKTGAIAAWNSNTWAERIKSLEKK